MNSIVSIDEQGKVTLPQDIIKKYDLEAGGQAILEETEVGLVLRPSTNFPVEIYSDERIEEFQRHNEDVLKKFRL